jgi:hypothetical protein
VLPTTCPGIRGGAPGLVNFLGKLDESVHMSKLGNVVLRYCEAMMEGLGTKRYADGSVTECESRANNTPPRSYPTGESARRAGVGAPIHNEKGGAGRIIRRLSL